MLIQFIDNEESRTFVDAKSPYEALETICRMYENYALQKKGVSLDSQGVL